MTKAPALTASSITRRLRRAGVEVSTARNLDRTYPQLDGNFVEVVGRVSVHLVTFDLVDGRIVERDVAAIAAAAAAVLEPAGFVVTRGGRDRELDVTVRPVPADDVVDLTKAETVVVIPCSGAKLDRPAPARQLYTGSLHRLAAAAGDATGRRVLILSALHGLLAGDDVVAPYDVRMTDADSIDAAELARQLVAAGRPRLVALTPGAYTRRLAEAAELAGCQLATPLAGSRGIGEIRGRLARIRDRRAALAA